MIFLKLGGSLITDKALPETVREETLARLAGEIREARAAHPGLRLLLGHGAGSFGHRAAAKFGTHRGAVSRDDWQGFAEVWYAAQRLHRRVMDALHAYAIPAVSFPPSASAVCRGGEIQSMAVEPIRHALDAGLLPVVFGDVTFDLAQGSTIVSTERVFAYLADPLRPTRLLLAGIEPGVFADFPERRLPLAELAEHDLDRVQLEGASETDVTGGMAAKVRDALGMMRAQPDLEVHIFSGEAPGAVREALLGSSPGTRLVR